MNNRSAHYANNISRYLTLTRQNWIATSKNSHLPWIQIPQTGGKTTQRDTQDWLNWHSAIYVHPRPPVPSERVFSAAGLTVNRLCTRLTPRTCEYVDFHEQEHIDGPVIGNVCPGNPCRQLFNSPMFVSHFSEPTVG